MEFHSSLNLLNSENTVMLEKRLHLLAAIERVGSISKAAKVVPMSYKAAWDAIDAINNLCPEPVVIRQTGGKGGGGAILTPYGKNLLQSYTILQKEHQKFLDHLTKMTDFNTGTLKPIKRIAMQLSARNQIRGVVEHIDVGSVNASVYIKLKSGYTLVSVITVGAIENLNLQVDDEVIAIIKSSAVLITTDISLNISARNKLNGVVETIHFGEINSEVIVNTGGDLIASVVTKNAIGDLELKVGDRVTAIIKSSDVMIGK